MANPEVDNYVNPRRSARAYGPTGLIYRCPECGDIPYTSEDDFTGNPDLWYRAVTHVHADCGRKEPPCPVRRSNLFHMRFAHKTNGTDGPVYPSDVAVAIAFQHAVERGMVSVCDYSPYGMSYFFAGVEYESPAAAVKAIWPETFKDLEAGDA